MAAEINEFPNGFKSWHKTHFEDKAKITLPHHY